MYMGQEGVNTDLFEYERDAECAACSNPVIQITIPHEETLSELVDRLKTDPARYVPGLGAVNMLWSFSTCVWSGLSWHGHL